MRHERRPKDRLGDRRGGRCRAEALLLGELLLEELVELVHRLRRVEAHHLHRPRQRRRQWRCRRRQAGGTRSGMRRRLRGEERSHRARVGIARLLFDPAAAQREAAHFEGRGGRGGEEGRADELQVGLDVVLARRLSRHRDLELGRRGRRVVHQRREDRREGPADVAHLLAGEVVNTDRVRVVLVGRLAHEVGQLARVDDARVVLAANDRHRHGSVRDGVVVDPRFVHWAVVGLARLLGPQARPRFGHDGRRAWGQGTDRCGHCRWEPPNERLRVLMRANVPRPGRRIPLRTERLGLVLLVEWASQKDAVRCDGLLNGCRRRVAATAVALVAAAAVALG